MTPYLGLALHIWLKYSLASRGVFEPKYASAVPSAPCLRRGAFYIKFCLRLSVTSIFSINFSINFNFTYITSVVKSLAVKAVKIDKNAITSSVS